MSTHQVLSCGHQDIPQLTHESHSSQTEFILTFIARGKLTLEVGPQIEIRKNSFIALPAGTPHSLQDGENLQVWWLSFCPHCLELDTDGELFNAFRQVQHGAVPVITTAPDQLSAIQFYFTELRDNQNAQGDSAFAVLRSLVILLLNEVNKGQQIANQQGIYSDKVVRALQYIQKNCLRSIGLDDVAEAVHCNGAYLTALVKKETQYSIGQWLTRSRLTMACGLLTHTNQPIAEIVEHLGWSDTTHFIRQFKKAFGTTPAAWRKQQKSTGAVLHQPSIDSKKP